MFNMFSLILLLHILIGLSANPLQNEYAENQGQHGHMYEQMYLTNHNVPPDGGFPNNENYDTYVPLIDGRPIFIPPIGDPFETSFSSEKRRSQHKRGHYKHRYAHMQRHPRDHLKFGVPNTQSTETLKSKPVGQNPIPVQTFPDQHYQEISYMNHYKVPPVGMLNTNVKHLPVQETNYEMNYKHPAVLEHKINSYEYDMPNVIDAKLGNQYRDQNKPQVNFYHSTFFEDPTVFQSREENYSHDLYNKVENLNKPHIIKTQPVKTVPYDFSYETKPDSNKPVNKPKPSLVIKKPSQSKPVKIDITSEVKGDKEIIKMPDFEVKGDKEIIKMPIDFEVKGDKEIIKMPIDFEVKGDSEIIKMPINFEEIPKKYSKNKVVKKPKTNHKKKPHSTKIKLTKAPIQIKPPVYDYVSESSQYEYDRPVIVEALLKKPIHPNQYDYSEYDNPEISEALIKKNLDYDYEIDDTDTDEELEDSNKTNEYEPKHPNKHMKEPTIGKHPNKQTKVSNKIYTGPLYDDGNKMLVPSIKSSEKPKHISKVQEYENFESEVRVGQKVPNFFDSKKSSLENFENIPDHKFDAENLQRREEVVSSGFADDLTVDSEMDSRGLFSKSNVWSLMSSFHAQERNKFKRCLTPNDEPGNCMPIQMCPTPNLQLTLDDLLKKVCSIDDVFIGICCPEFPAEKLKVDWENINSSSSDKEELSVEKPNECGKFDSQKDIHSWPWMAPLISVSTRRIFCGGVLITDRYVLTAAHCTRKIPHNQILVVLGPMADKRNSNQEYEVVEIKRHAQYNPRTMQNDMALLKLSKRVPLGQQRLVCLPEEENYDDKEALMLGWKGSFAASKKEESLRVISIEECQRGTRMIVSDSTICTEPRTEDVMCNLDSGAPLIVKNNGQYKVIGVLTWNRNDCDSSVPSIFTRVSYFRRWIENHTT